MQNDFERTMNSESQENFTAPTEIDKIKSKLRDNSFVIVAGHNKSFYLAAALSAVQEMSYHDKRCAQMNTSSDWSHIDPEDVDFVLCCDPFGRDSFEEERSKGMADIFSSIQYTVNEERDGNKLAVMIVTDIAVLNECKEKHSHEILEDVVTVYDTTSGTHPVDLTVARCTRYIQPGSTLTQNLKEQTRLFLQYHEIASKHVDSGIVNNAKEKLKAKKAVVLVGPEGSGKTSLAVALAASYQPSQVLLLAYPEQVQHVHYKSTGLVIIEDFAGIHTFNHYQTENWYRTFNQLDIMKTAGQISIVITCDKEKLEKCCKEIATHHLLAHTVELTDKMMCIKEEIVNDDTHQAQSVSKESIISLDESSSSQQWESPVNLSLPKYSSADRVNICKDLTNFTGDEFVSCTSMCLTKDRSICVAAVSLMSDKELYRLAYQDSGGNRTQACSLEHRIDQMCHTKAGEIVAVTNRGRKTVFCINVYRIIDSVVETKASKYLRGLDSECKAVSCDDNDHIYVLFSDGKIKTYMYEMHSMRLVVVKEENTLNVPQLISTPSDQWNINHKGYTFISNGPKVYYRNFRSKRANSIDYKESQPRAICTASEEPYSLFVAEDGKILQYNTECQIISDISLPGYLRVEHMVFDETSSRLICHNKVDKKLYEIYLK